MFTFCLAAAPLVQGLGSGLYSLQVRAVDTAGNAGNASLAYPFEVGSC